MAAPDRHAAGALEARAVLQGLWQAAQLPPDALGQVQLSGADPVLPSSFAVGAAAQATMAAAALAACELGHARGVARQQVSVDMRQAALECVGWFSLDGRVPAKWDPFSGLYRSRDGWVRIHANFAHHRDGALRLLGLNPSTAQRGDAEHAMLGWRAEDFEDAAAQAGLVATALRSFEQWDAHPQGQAVAAQPLFTLERIGEAAPRALPALGADSLPLSGLRVLDLTRILAGPVCGRTLAGYGADVMLVNAPQLPNIESIADTSRGKLSTHIDLRTPQGCADLARLLEEAHVFVQGYRPGGLDALGFGPQAVAALRPGIVYVSLSAYGEQGPWRARRGFDSLVQTATGFNLAEAQAAGMAEPRALPIQILDYATGYLMAFAVAAALRRQRLEGGSWHARLSLAQTGRWIRELGRVEHGFAVAWPEAAPYLETSASGFGELVATRHSVVLSRSPARWLRPSMPPGTHAPAWP
ncbi:CoA transferase [Variovorax sp. CYS-02]|uniref:CoA transferase n=1 Tax=Variovorax terrae TaxID=2923278 RepID=A0A9X1VXI9_9BURK|nr:CoA transferase [Variovorax terrae]